MKYNSETGETVYKINDQVVSGEEYDEYKALSKEDRQDYVVKAKGNANNIVSTNNNIRDGVAERASYEEGAEETVLIQEPDTKSDSNQTETGETKTLVVNTGATEDAYESLYMR